MVEVVLLVIAGLLGLAGGQEPVAARFHHVHYTVDDPAEAMADTVKVTDGVRVIVQGFGVGVRTGREFVLFDRRSSQTARARGTSAAAAYRSAAALLQSSGFAVDPPASDRSRALQAVPALAADHVGFAVDDVTAAVARLEARGARVLHRGHVAVVLEAEDGLKIEILMDTDREERFWCPMHPDVRSADAGTCPLCAMDLVAIPPPKVGEYGLNVTLDRDRASGTVRRLRFEVREPGTNDPVPGLQVVHEKPFHLFVVGRDLEYFRHLHPERVAAGSFELQHALPPGEYMLIADFLPIGGTSQMVQRAVLSGRLSGAADAGPVSPPNTPRRMTVDGLTVSLETGPIRVGRDVQLTFTISDAATGRPVTDLEPYLGAPAHMLIVPADLSDAIHAHPEDVVSEGPTVSFHPVLPGEGAYRLWIQFQRRGRVITFPFWLRTEK